MDKETVKSIVASILIAIGLLTCIFLLLQGVEYAALAVLA